MDPSEIQSSQWVLIAPHDSSIIVKPPGTAFRSWNAPHWAWEQSKVVDFSVVSVSSCNERRDTSNAHEAKDNLKATGMPQACPSHVH